MQVDCKGVRLEVSQLIINHYYLERKRDAQREGTKLRVQGEIG